MLFPRTPSQTIVQAFATMLWCAAMAGAQITSLCNTGLTPLTAFGCTSDLVPPNPPGGGPNRDGNWHLAYPYPSRLATVHAPCLLKGFLKAWVDTPNAGWLSNSASTASEWITPADGENNLPAGWYVYRITFYIPAVLPGGAAPTRLTVNGHLASDNPTVSIYMESPADSAKCALVSSQAFPVNPGGQGGEDFEEWWDFSFINSLPITPGEFAYLYFVVENAPPGGGATPTGLRVEFFLTSTFN